MVESESDCMIEIQFSYQELPKTTFDPPNKKPYNPTDIICK